MTRVVHPFPPVVDEKSRVLILGSFPSTVSRKMQFYYANHNNRFWKDMEILFEETIMDREAFCHAHHIALWDVIASCSIQGSSDASIRDVKVNDINALIQNTEIHTIFTTGAKAFDLMMKHVCIDVPVVRLPSTSSANAAMRLDDLVEKYRVIVEETCR